MAAIALLMELVKIGHLGDRQYHASIAFKAGWMSLAAGFPLWILAHLVKILEHVLGAVFNVL